MSQYNSDSFCHAFEKALSHPDVDATSRFDSCAIWPSAESTCHAIALRLCLLVDTRSCSQALASPRAAIALRILSL